MTELLTKYINNTCTPEEQKEVIEQLTSKTLSVGLLHFLKQHWRRLKGDEITDPADFDAVLHRIHHTINLKEAQDTKTHTFVRRLRLFAATAAAAVLIFMASVGVWYSGHMGLFQKEVFYTVSSVRGQSSSVTLSDGSKVWLNGESSVVYSSRYGTDSRNLELKGEGFFDVAKNTKLPFVVEVGDIQITALGTKFNVDAYETGEAVKVTLEEGSVRVNKADRSAMLKPGMQASVDDQSMDVKKVDTELYTSWYQGRIVFKDERLGTITDQLEKMYDVKFIYRSDTLRSYRYRGTISLDNSILKALEMLRVSTGIRYRVEGEKVILENRLLGQ